MITNARLVLLLAVLLTVCVPNRVLAHALGVTCRLKGEVVEVEVYYEDDTPAANAKVRVRDAQYNDIATGRTDAQGVWSFSRPAPGTYRVSVDAGGGHRKLIRLTIPEPTVAAPPASETGDRRETFTAFPWLGVLAGLAIIAALAGGALLVGRLRRHGRT